jgi:DNA-binding MarR family transcriptional regulator
MKGTKTPLNESVVENLMAIYPLLSKNFARAIRTKTTFTPGVLFTLGALYHHKRLTMSGIGCHLSIPKPHATILVNKLIKDDLVVRLPDPNDRRVIYIELTEKGRDTLKSLKSIVAEELTNKLILLTEGQMQILSTASGQVKETLILLGNLLAGGETPACCKQIEE